MSEFERSVVEYVETLAVMPGPLTDDDYFDVVVSLVGRDKKLIWAILKNSGRVRRESRQHWLDKINNIISINGRHLGSSAVSEL